MYKAYLKILRILKHTCIQSHSTFCTNKCCLSNWQYKVCSTMLLTKNFNLKPLPYGATCNTFGLTANFWFLVWLTTVKYYFTLAALEWITGLCLPTFQIILQISKLHNKAFYSSVLWKSPKTKNVLQNSLHMLKK